MVYVHKLPNNTILKSNKKTCQSEQYFSGHGRQE